MSTPGGPAAGRAALDSESGPGLGESLVKKAHDTYMQTFHPLASVTVAGCHFTRSKWGRKTLAFMSNLRSKHTHA